jgi:hypothetical protein
VYSYVKILCILLVSVANLTYRDSNRMKAPQVLYLRTFPSLFEHCMFLCIILSTWGSGR